MHFKQAKFSNKASVDVLVEFRTAPNPSRFFQKYNIVYNNDGSIYDLDLHLKFNSMYNWADTIINMEFNEWTTGH